MVSSIWCLFRITISEQRDMPESLLGLSRLLNDDPYDDLRGILLIHVVRTMVSERLINMVYVGQS